MEVKEVSEALGVSENELVKRGVKAYLEMELRRVKAETYSILSKYEVGSFIELDERISRGDLSETEMFEDFTRLDYLESMREKIEGLLEGST
ncbi:MAG: hypothetical protein JRI56_08975 [Deltaproteobacteria bacterium]|nr:hypothetical protein [Deltaproteobacteria bacterium]